MNGWVMKRVLMFALFGPLIGWLLNYLIPIALKTVGIITENPSDLGVGFFVIALIYAYIYITPASLLVGIVSNFMSFEKQWQWALLCALSACTSSLCLHVFFRVKLYDLIMLAFVPSIIVTLLIGSFIKWKGY
jgi:hypothetical protein